jgi:hypothetical protein
MMSSTYVQVERNIIDEFSYARADEVKNAYATRFLLPPPFTIFSLLLSMIAKYLSLIYCALWKSNSFAEANNGYGLFYSGSPGSWLCAFCFKENLASEKERLTEKEIWGKISKQFRLPLEILYNTPVLCSKCLLPKTLCTLSSKQVVESWISNMCLSLPLAGAFISFKLSLHFSCWIFYKIGEWIHSHRKSKSKDNVQTQETAASAKPINLNSQTLLKSNRNYIPSRKQERIERLSRLIEIENTDITITQIKQSLQSFRNQFSPVK